MKKINCKRIKLFKYKKGQINTKLNQMDTENLDQSLKK